MTLSARRRGLLLSQLWTLALLSAPALAGPALPPPPLVFADLPRTAAAAAEAGARDRETSPTFGRKSALEEAAPSTASTTASTAACVLDTADRARTPSSACTACHQHQGHPTGMNYAAAAYDERTQLRPALHLPRQVVLGQAGEVTCTTCHDGRSVREHKTALDGNKALCLACHDYGTSAQDFAAFPPGEAVREQAAAAITAETRAGGEGGLLLRRALAQH